MPAEEAGGSGARRVPPRELRRSAVVLPPGALRVSSLQCALSRLTLSRSLALSCKAYLQILSRFHAFMLTSVHAFMLSCFHTNPSLKPGFGGIAGECHL